MSICLKKPSFLKLQEVFKDWQKFMAKQSESCHTSFLTVPIESLAEMKPETQKSYLEWLDQRFKSKAFSDAIPSKMLSTSYRFVQITAGKLEFNHHTSRIQIWPIRNKQTKVFQKTPQTMDADLMEICGIEQIILCSRFRKCIGV